jgi:hypothetical protein
MAVSIKRTSRLRFSTLRLINGFTFFERADLPKIDPADDDTVYQVEDTDRIDSLSQKFYGTPDLWWVIARANNLVLLPRDLKVGMRLSIPTRVRVLTKILPVEG